MDAALFRRLALRFPETVEGSHQGHPDFRVGGRIFASLGPGEQYGMVKIPLPLQTSMVQHQPEAFEPFAGAWGRAGCTKVHLAHTSPATLVPLLLAAWRTAAPESLHSLLPSGGDEPPP